MIDVHFFQPGEDRARPASGPGDLSPAGPASTVVVRGEHGGRDSGNWAPALGLAVLRGASVKRLAA